MISLINLNFGTINANDIRYKEDIVRSLTKSPGTEGISLLPKDIVISHIVISRVYCMGRHLGDLDGVLDDGSNVVQACSVDTRERGRKESEEIPMAFGA
jgi:hypothetical protein